MNFLAKHFSATILNHPRTTFSQAPLMYLAEVALSLEEASQLHNLIRLKIVDQVQQLSHLFSLNNIIKKQQLVGHLQAIPTQFSTLVNLALFSQAEDPLYHPVVLFSEPIIKTLYLISNQTKTKKNKVKMIAHPCKLRTMLIQQNHQDTMNTPRIKLSSRNRQLS